MCNVIDVKDLTIAYQRKKERHEAVRGVSFQIGEGETLGLVGESGCGKSSIAKALLRLIPSKGKITFEGVDVNALSGAALLPYRRQVQMIFQDPYSCLNPKMKVKEILREPFDIHNVGSDLEKEELCKELLEQVDLPKHFSEKYPEQLSGGERQRIGIARALALKPKLVICDEPMSALDITHQIEIAKLLKRFQRERGISYLFISHDLSAVRYMSHRVAVMKDGIIADLGSSAPYLGSSAP